jgi:peptide deformylase
MAVKDILLLGNLNLRKLSLQVDFNRDNVDEIFRDLKDTLENFQNRKGLGRAIAAPQISYLKRMIYINDSKNEIKMVNPHILYCSREKIQVWDTCFSFKAEFYVKIKRFKKIKVQYLNENKEEKTEIFEDSMSELIQHEIDHLNGILAVDHLENSRNIIMRDEFENRLDRF